MLDEVKLTVRGEATRARSGAAAAELMFARGVSGTSLDDVLVASGTSKSQIYHYFADRDALIAAVARYQTERVLGVQRKVLANAVTLDALHRWRDAVLSIAQITGCAGGCPVGSLASQIGQQEVLRRALVGSFVEWEAMLCAYVERLRDASVLRRDADAAGLATALVAAFQGGFLLAQTARAIRPLQIALDMAVDHVQRQRA